MISLSRKKRSSSPSFVSRLQNCTTAQAAQLAAPAELLVVGNRSLEMVQSYTRSREDLLFGLDHIPAALPLKVNGSSFDERFSQSIDALQQIAL